MKYPANIVTKVYKPNWNSNRNLIIALLVCLKSTFEPTESTLLSMWFHFELILGIMP